VAAEGRPEDAPSPSQSIARNTAVQLGVQVTSGAFTAALTLVLVRVLSPDGYGTFTLALAIGAVLMLLADLGVSSSAARFIAERRGNRGAVAAVMSNALRLKLAVSGVVSVALFASAGPIARIYEADALVWPLRWIAVAMFGQSVMLLFVLAFVALARSSSNLGVVLAESVVETSATVGLLLLGAGAAGAAGGRAVGYVVGAAIGLVVTARLLGRAAIRLRSSGGDLKGRIVRYAGAVALVDWLYTALAYADAILIGLLLDTAAVGLFQAPMRLIPFLLYPALAIAYGVAPRLARHEDEQPNVGAFVSAMRLLVIVHCALLAPLIVWGGPIAELLFGAEYGESANVLRGLAPYVLLAGLAPLASATANFVGAARSRVPIAIAALVANIAANLALIPLIGIMGATIAIGIAFAIYVPAHIYVCRRVLDFSLRGVARTFVKALLAAAAMAGVLFVVGTSDLSAVQWLVGAVAGTAAFAAVLAATGEVGVAEIRLARSAVTRLRAGAL
jgi:O-antigen/teichoic acid export membrane protein